MNRKSIIALHIFFWLVVEAGSYQQLVQHTDMATRDILDALAIVLSHIITFYFFYFIFIRCLKRNIYFTVGAYVLAYGLIYVLRFGGFPFLYEVLGKPDILSYTIAQWCSFYESFMFGMYATFIGLIESRANSAKLEKDLYQQNTKSEMDLLRSQINPHFLYNVLNNIYSLAYPKSTKAAQAVMKLSEIMRYSLSEANQKFVPLEKEIEYLQSYLSLEQMRYKDASFIEFNVEGEIEDKVVAPMLFVPFVENAFKHGLINETIKISLKIEKNSLLFQVSNHYNKTSKVSNGSGIGLKNVKRRLELIYPEKHKLYVKEGSKASIFNVSLQINLTHEN